MNEIKYRNRRAAHIETESVRITVTAEGGHVAEILHKATGVNPLWTPPWPSIEPSAYRRATHPEYGPSDEAHVLSGLMGHNICLDTFGGPSPEEFAAGIPVHGEGSVAAYDLGGDEKSITLKATLPLAELQFDRQIRLCGDGSVIHFAETVENLSAGDRPIAWTQHVTLGPPFIEPGKSQLRAPATRSKVNDVDFTGGRGKQKTGAEFAGFLCPRKDGGVIDLRTYPGDAVSAGFTIHLMDPDSERAYFIAWSPSSKLVFGYVWNRADFPWLCRWEENHFRTDPPWNGQTITCGIEFGASPTVESRREMVTRGSLFGTPAYRWAPAKTKLKTEYCAFIGIADSIPERVEWDGQESIRLS